MIDILCININSIDYQKYRLIRHIVSKERCDKADKFKQLEDSIRCVCAELLLYYELNHKYGHYADYSISYGRYGKPFIKEQPDFFYNTSHSGEWVVGAYGNGKVGVDVEMVQNIRCYEMEGLYSKEEIEWMYEDAAEKNYRFIEIWTAKESYLKFVGTGLYKDIYSFYIDMPKRKIIERKNDYVNEDLNMFSFYLDSNHHMTVCTESEINTITKVDVSELINYF